MDLDLVQVACAAVSVTDPDDGFGALSLLRYDPQTANTSPSTGERDRGHGADHILLTDVVWAGVGERW